MLGITLAITALIAEPAWTEEEGADVTPVGRPVLQEVVVTGSRIPVQSGPETLPVTVLDSADLERGGLDALGKILQALPMSAASVMNTNVNNDGDGSARLDLRALGPRRTLVLLNGHRFPNGGVGGDDSVDLNSLPLAMIDRVEVLTSGASTIYGADAVAGVVNFITRRRLEGLEFSGDESRSDRGDGRINRFTLSAGHELLGGSLLLGGEYVDQRSISQGARSFSAVPLTIADFSGTRVPTGSFTLPDGVFGIPSSNALGLPPGYYTRLAGSSGRGAANFRSMTDADTFNYAPHTYLQTPNERGSLWLLGDQPLAPGLKLHVEGLWHHRRSSQLLAPSPYESSFDPAPRLADGSQGIPANNYYNPFGIDLFDVRRRLMEISNRGFRQGVDMHRVLAGLEGRRGSWSFGASLALSRSSATRLETGSVPGQRMVTALGPSGRDASGRIVCGTPDPMTGIVPAAATIPGCVPVDLFGGVGTITPEQAASLTMPLTDHGTDAERLVNLDAQGPFGHLPGGPIWWGFGAEYRRESGSFVFDPLHGGGTVGSGGEHDLPGANFSAREVYLEVRAPLARNLRWVRQLTASAGVRGSDFSSFGSHFTWQAGLLWQPVRDWGLRGSYARVFRAPDLAELYERQHAGATFGFDPCGNDPSPTQRQHCAANGVPGGAYTQSEFASINVLLGGNPSLAPETGYSFDAGLELRPAGWPGFQATLDWYQIDLAGYIDNPAINDVLQQCADRGTPDVCSLVRRDSAGNVIAAALIPRNFGHSVVNGLDGSASMNLALASGHLRIAATASYLGRHDIQPFVGGATFRESGTLSVYASALPRWRSVTHADFDRGRWHGGYSAQWLGGFTECGQLQNLSGTYCRRVGGVVYHDIEAAVRWGTAVSARIGVSNLTNRQPPFLNFGPDANTDPSVYRLAGRTLFVSLRCTIH